MVEKADIFSAIAHPLRIDILKALEKRSARFNDLKHQFGIKSSGTLDFHIKKLGPLISTGNNGQYQLSNQGYTALESIRAIERLRFTRLGFFGHLIGYCLGNFLIFLVWLGSSWEYVFGIPGFVFPLVGWGIGLLGHFYLVIIRRFPHNS